MHLGRDKRAEFPAHRVRAKFAAVGLDMTAAVGLLAAVAGIMVIVGLLAAIGPARRSLRVQPVEALRS